MALIMREMAVQVIIEYILPKNKDIQNPHMVFVVFLEVWLARIAFDVEYGCLFSVFPSVLLGIGLIIGSNVVSCIGLTLLFFKH